MAEDSEPRPDSKLTRSKQRWAQEGRFLTGRTARPEEARLPPGQHLTRDWPTLDLGLTPEISTQRWRLDVYGAIDNPIFWDFSQFYAQAQTEVVSDIHCVTTWSRYDNQWTGLPTRQLLDACHPHEDARFVVLHSYDGYTTNLSLEDFAAEDALLAHSWSGTPLSAEHGGPVRLVVPISISGRARSGCRQSSSSHPMRRATGKCAAITIAAIPGRSSGIRAIDNLPSPLVGEGARAQRGRVRG
jgi:DMSO/TMAO reductase YedYZ molybdopterin-dependent catalytic subunit